MTPVEQRVIDAHLELDRARDAMGQAGRRRDRAEVELGHALAELREAKR